jgi:hypothetical protein
MFEKAIKKILIMFLILVPMVQGAWARAETVISTLFANGFFQSEMMETRVLFCEGNIPCATIEGSLISFGVRPDGSLEEFLNLKTCLEDGSCLTVRNAHFIDDPIPELDPVLRDAAEREIQNAGIVSSPVATWIASTSVLTEEDPLLCSDGTGKFSDPQCVDQLDFHLDYRCLVLFNLDTGEEFTFSGTFIVTKANP